VPGSAFLVVAGLDALSRRLGAPIGTSCELDSRRFRRGVSKERSRRGGGVAL
ncbi:unnamed protein product, partial [Ascophyllum nodosum]